MYQDTFRIKSLPTRGIVGQRKPQVALPRRAEVASDRPCVELFFARKKPHPAFALAAWVDVWASATVIAPGGSGIAAASQCYAAVSEK
jgi:hypothetical protein